MSRLTIAGLISLKSHREDQQLMSLVLQGHLENVLGVLRDVNLRVGKSGKVNKFNRNADTVNCS